MQTIGIIGGIAPGSTIEYYRQLIALYRHQEPSGNYPSIIINSINLKEMLALVEADRLTDLIEFLVREIGKLERAGAGIGLMASNTPHLVFDEIRRRSKLPLVSIVETTFEAVQKMNLKKVGLFGTRFTMEGATYRKVFAESDIELCLPPEKDRAYIHNKYMAEFVQENFLPETKKEMLEIIGRMKTADRIEGLILGGTELPLILTDPAEAGIPFLDTTRLHAEAVIARVF